MVMCLPYQHQLGSACGRISSMHHRCPVAASAQSSLHGQNGDLNPLQLQRGSSRSWLTRLRSWFHSAQENRHLPQLIESRILAGASEATAVSIVVQMAEHMALTLDQMREGARLPASQTAKQDHHALTAETSVTLRQYKQAVE